MLVFKVKEKYQPGLFYPSLNDIFHLMRGILFEIVGTYLDKFLKSRNPLTPWIKCNSSISKGKRLEYWLSIYYNDQISDLGWSISARFCKENDNIFMKKSNDNKFNY